MARTIAAGMLTEITSAGWRPIVLAYLDYPSGAARMWDGIGNLSWDSQTWAGVGALGTVAFASETEGVQANGATLSVSGLDPSKVSIALGDKIRGRAVSIWLGALTAGGAVVADPLEMFSGRMDHMTMTEPDESDGTAIINVHCESHLIDLNRASEWRYSHEHQNQLFPGDDGFVFAATTVDQEIHWMRPNVQRSIPVASNVRRRG